MDTTYAGFYAKFDTASKKDAAVLLGADNLVGDIFEIAFVTENGESIAWLKNRFGMQVAFFDAETSRQLRIYEARGLALKAILSYVAYTDSPSPGHYWGEAAIICYAQAVTEQLVAFTKHISARIAEGVRPDINLGEQGIQQVIDSNGTWIPKNSVPLPPREGGTAVVKSHLKISEKVIEQGRKGNKGCYLISWLFLLAAVAGIIFGLKSCGLF